jgi:hypothetical protein
MNINSSSSRPTAGKVLDLENLLYRLFDSTIHQEVPKLLRQQARHGLVAKAVASQTL